MLASCFFVNIAVTGSRMLFKPPKTRSLISDIFSLVVSPLTESEVENSVQRNCVSSILFRDQRRDVIASSARSFPRTDQNGDNSKAERLPLSFKFFPH